MEGGTTSAEATPVGLVVGMFRKNMAEQVTNPAEWGATHVANIAAPVTICQDLPMLN